MYLSLDMGSCEALVTNSLSTRHSRLTRGVASLIEVRQLTRRTNMNNRQKIAERREIAERGLTPIPMKYCLYSRKSSEQDELQALSIESQIKEMLLIAEKENLNVVEIYRESHSAKESGQRPVFNQMLTDIRSGKFNGILTWHPDRISRNAGDLGIIVDFLDQKKLIEIRTYSQKFTNNPSEKFLFMILGSQAKLENDNKSVNVKRGLKTKCELRRQRI